MMKGGCVSIRMKTAVVYLVAGMSSRFGGKIKQFAKVGPNGETLIEYSMKQAIEAGFDEIIFVVGEKTEAPFREMFGDDYKGTPIKYAKQSYNPQTRDRPWGTVDALLAAKDIIDCPFTICNGDDIYGVEAFKTIHEYLTQNDAACTVGFRLGKTVPEEGTVTRGIFEVDDNNNIVKITETPNIEKARFSEMNLSDDTLCNVNMIALPVHVLDHLDAVLQEFKRMHEGDRKAECLLPTELGNLISEGKLVMKLIPTEAQWYGVTNPGDEEVVKAALAEQA